MSYCHKWRNARKHGVDGGRSFLLTPEGNSKNCIGAFLIVILFIAVIGGIIFGIPLSVVHLSK
jgi:hypothetical protein